MYESPCDDVYYQYSSWQAKFLIWPFSYLTTIEFCYWYIIAKASEQELSLKFGELQDVLSPGHRIHDLRSRGRRSDLVKLPNKRNETFSYQFVKQSVWKQRGNK